MKCVMMMSESGNFVFGNLWDMHEYVKIDCDEFLLKSKTFIPDEITDNLEESYKTVIRRLNLR